MFITKGADPQVVLGETAARDIERWNPSEMVTKTKMTPVIMQTFQLFQTDSLEVWALDEEDMRIVSYDSLVDATGIRRESHQARWSAEGEMVVITAIRPTAEDGWNPELVNVWEAMEALNLTLKMQ